MRLITAGWMMGIIWMLMVTGSRLNVFARMLGFNDFHFGMITAVTFLATFAQLFATIAVERSGLKKYQFLLFASISRALWVVIAVIPLFLPVPSHVAVWTMLVLVLVSHVLMSLALPAWWTWMGDLLPRRIRGQYFAVRNIISQLVRIPVVVALGLVLDHVTRDGAGGGAAIITAADQPVLLLCVCGVFVLAGILGTLDILVFFGIREVVGTTPDKPRKPAVDIRIDAPRREGMIGSAAYLLRYLQAVVKQLLIDPMKDPVFRRYVAYGATVTFALTVGGQYYWRNSLENLKFGQLGTDMLFLVLGPLAGIASVRLFGRLLDRWGRRPVLVVGTSLIVVSITPYFFATPHTPAPAFVVDSVNAVVGAVGSLFGRGDAVWLTPAMPVGPWMVMTISMVLGGAGWTAVMMGQNNIILSFADGHGRSKYVAAHGVLVAMGGVVGGVVGGVSSYLTRGQHLCFGPVDAAGNHTVFAWNNWHVPFAISFCARIVALLLLINMTDPGARPVRQMLRLARQNVYNALSGLRLPMRVFGRFRNTDD